MGFADYPFTSRDATIDGHRLHDIDEGPHERTDNEPMPTLLFLHGNPASRCLWRNVIKPLSATHRCVALALTDIHLVLHDRGGPLGFRLMQTQPQRLIPCHRVRPCSDGLRGYHRGLAGKKALLATEGVLPR